MTTKDDPIEVLRFVNDYRKEMARVKVKSFYAFHSCQLRCFKPLDNERSRECMTDCERDLDEFHRWRKSSKPEGPSKVYYGPKLFDDGEMKHNY